MITFTNGNIFDARVEAIVNTVNLVGVMGKGIALQFKERFKDNYNLYRNACQTGTIDIGKLLVVPSRWLGNDIYIVNFPTKRHWRNLSEYAFIEAGLDDLVRIIDKYKILSIAIPPLGAGNGGLDWNVVRRLIQTKLSDLDCDILIFEPGATVHTEPKSISLTPARALTLSMLNTLRLEGFDTTAFAAVKLIYFLQKFGASEFFKLQFVPHIYGPYCHAVPHLLHALDGAYICGYADMNKKAFEPFGLIAVTMPEVEKYISEDMILTEIINESKLFLDGFYDDFSLELFSSIDYLMMANPSASCRDIYKLLTEWSPRKRELFADFKYTEEAYRHLSQS